MRNHGQADQEPLGATNLLDSCCMYVKTPSFYAAPSGNVLTPLADQIAAAIEGFFWPKFFFDWLTKNFDGAVKPIPTLQIINLVIGIISLAYEWPLKYIAGTALQRSLEARMLWLPLASMASILLYQATNPALYYFIGCIVYFWAYSEGEVSLTGWKGRG